VRAARSVSADRIELVDLPEPAAGSGDVVCRMLACGVCKSDLLDWYVAPKLPAVLGHELAAEVSAVGDGVAGIAVGDRVVVDHHAPCGECRRCARGHETLCEHFRAVSLDPGGFAEEVRVPAGLVAGLLPFGTDVDPVVASFTEPLACVLRALDHARVRAGDSVLIVGSGSNGLLAIAAAHARGVEAVWVREPNGERLERALAWGAERHGTEPVDAAIICTHAEAAVADAAPVVAPGGVLLLYGPPRPGSPLPIDADAMFRRELTVTSSFSAGPDDMRAALDLLTRGRVDAAALVTHRFALEQTGDAFAAARDGTALKAVVVA
jgi:L-iditol 2-dehydrogenase